MVTIAEALPQLKKQMVTIAEALPQLKKQMVTIAEALPQLKMPNVQLLPIRWMVLTAAGALSDKDDAHVQSAMIKGTARHQDETAGP